MVKAKITKKAINKKFKCSPCAISAAIGVYNNVCNKLKDGECKKIIDKLADDKISLDKAFRDIKKRAKGHPKELRALQYVDKILKEG